MSEEIEAIKKLQPGEEAIFQEVENPALGKLQENLIQLLEVFQEKEIEVSFKKGGVRLGFRLEGESDLVVKRLR